MSCPQRILITRTDRIGDLVVSTPIFQALREKFPQAHLAVCVFSEHRELVQGNPFVDEVILYEKKGRQKNWLGQFQFAQMIRKKKFDCVIHLHATNRMHLMSWLAGIPIRIGYTRRASWTLTQAHPYDKKEGLKHETDYLHDLISSLGITNAALTQTHVPVSEKNRLSVANLLEHYGINGEKIAAIHPSASDETKMWPAEKFAELIKRMTPSPRPLPQGGGKGEGFRWVAVGSHENSFQTQKIAELSGVTVTDLCGQLSLGMLAALFEKSKLVISNDSGPAHIAAAVGAPTVSIFGRWQPGLNAERWRPLGKHVAVVKPEIDAIPEGQRKFSYIEDITVEQVINAINQLVPSVPRTAYIPHPVPLPVEGEGDVVRSTHDAVHKIRLRRILVVQPYGIGDMLFITPVLRALRLISAVERVDLLIGSRTQAVIAANPHVDDVIVIDKDAIHQNSWNANFLFIKNLGETLRSRQYDLLLDYSIRGEYAFWSQFFLGIPKRAGYAYKNRAFFHNVRLPIPNGFENKHVVDFVCDLAEKAGVPVRNRFIEFFFSKIEEENLKQELLPRLPEEYFALSLGGGESWGQDAHLKRWPVEKFAELSRHLLKKNPQQKIVLVGSAGETELAVEFMKAGLPTENLVGKLSISETAWVLKNSKFFVGNDGGLLHLARAVFKPVIGIYGPADPKVYGPYQQKTPGAPRAPGVESVSVAVYKPPVDGKPRYFKFRYDKNDRSLQDLSVEEAVGQIQIAFDSRVL